MVSVGIPREDRASKRLYAKELQNHSVNAIANFCSTKDLQRASDLMGLEDNVQDNSGSLTNYDHISQRCSPGIHNYLRFCLMHLQGVLLYLSLLML